MIRIELKDIEFSYQSGADSCVQVLRHLNLTVCSGEIIGLIGKNGNGKSTLLNLLKGNLKPQKGTVDILDNGVRIARNHHYVPLVSQTVDSNLFPTLTVYENFCVFKEKGKPLAPYSSSRKYDYCKELLCRADMGIESKIDEQVRFLSGGQKQAISILFALEYEYPILLMDEPTASLDPFVSRKIIELSRKEILNRNGILILVSHNLRDILKYTDKIWVLSEGQIKELTGNQHLQDVDLMKLM